MLIVRFLIGSVIAIACVGNIIAASPQATQPIKRPNLVLCMADDLGWGDTGYNGHARIKTPHLDEMAKAGARLNRFYVGSPLCIPSRAGLLTGRVAVRCGMGNDPGATTHLRDEETTIAELVKTKGYATGHFGKWHLGMLTPDYRGEKKVLMTPGMAGFDEWFSTPSSVATFDPYIDPGAIGRALGGPYRPAPIDQRAGFIHNGKPLAEPVEGCAAEIVMDRALDFIRAKAENDRPFLAVIWFNPPHSPVVGNPRYMAQHYADLPENQQHYYSLATAVDAQMGRLRNTLRELGIADQTLLVFTSDNGPGPPVGRTFKPDARLQGSAGPFRERKASLYEGGIRVPGLIEWPTQIRSGTVIDAPCTTLDYLPTIATLLDIELPRRPFDGIDLMPLLTGAQQERGRPIGFYFRDAIALSDDRFKLIDAKQSRGRGGNDRAFDDRKFELFDLIADPGETTDVSDRHPDIVIAMKSELKTWVASVENSHDGNDYQAGKTRLFLLSGQSNMKNLDPETTFLPTLRKSFPNDTLILVKVAYGGRSISRWVPRGKIYAELLGKAKEAIEKNGTATNDLDSISFVWMQGERDHQQDATTQAYADNLRQLRRQLIDDFGREDISWVIGRLSDARVSTANWDTIRQIQVDFANGNSFAKWVDTDDLNGVNNGVHCPPEGYDEMGKRFATAAIELIQKEETN